MITRLNPRKKPARSPFRQAIFILERALVVLVALMTANTIGCNNLALTPRSIVTIDDIKAGAVQWTGTTTVTREAPKVTLSLQPGSSPVNYYSGEAQYYLPNGSQAQLQPAKFAFSAYLAFPNSDTAQPLTKEYTLDGLITKDLIDYSSRQNKNPESYDITAVTVLSGQNIHGDTVRTIIRIPITFDYE